MNYIEETLYEKTKDFQEGHVYSDQWKFAKSYLPTFLDTISHVFPHYSLHNATHSEAILNNIVRILGTENIKKLSVVDLWLLLAAAYYHDCGMVVTGDDKRHLFKDSSDFVKYVEDTQKDKSSPLYAYAQLFDVNENKVFYKYEQLTHESYEGARFLLADYIRSKHAERSEKRIEKDGSLHFPGEPIPERIIRILKKICCCHTKDVNEVMDLQYVESSGCGIEDCHPRFVAAMLRLGDLLDVDSNRISEVLLSSLGSIPSDSKYYNKTNRAITHIRIDTTIIEITADCDDYHVADLINRWFQWLNDELVFYMKRWHKIIPFKDFGYLPTVGDLKVNLSNYDTFDGKKRPSFEIDSMKAIELLQGAGLYTDSCECIRELLQNAVDATYLRVYKENPGIDNIKKFKEKCANYPITIKLDKSPHCTTDKNGVFWKIEIKDKGIGMTKEDLHYLSRTGSSGRNIEKKKLIQSVPEFLRPSGTFGIGFQSVFLVTDSVDIVTRKVNKDSYVKAQMHNPSGKERGAILIQSVDKEDVDYGTSLSFVFKDENKGQRLLRYEDRYSVAEFNSFDFAKTKHVNIMGMKVMDEVVRFANGTFIPVDFFLEGEKKKYVSNKCKIDFGDIDSDTGIQVFIEKTIANTSRFVESKVYYRNQWVRDYDPNLPFLVFHINVLRGSAKDVLTLNRNNIRREYEGILTESIKQSVIRYLNKKIESLDTPRKQLASMFLYLYKDYAKEKGILDIYQRDYWKSYQITVKKDGAEDSEVMTLEKILTADSIARVNRDEEPDLFTFDIAGARYSFIIDYYMTYWIYLLLFQIAQNNGYHICFKKNALVLNKTECSIIEDSIEAREQILFDYIRSDERARGLFPCHEKYKDLQIDKSAFPQLLSGDNRFQFPQMICPYIRKYDLEYVNEAISLEYDVDSKVINTVYDNRLNKSVTKEQIKKAYDLFKNDWSAIVERVNTRAKKEPHFYSYPSYRIVI